MIVMTCYDPVRNEHACLLAHGLPTITPEQLVKDMLHKYMDGWPVNWEISQVSSAKGYTAFTIMDVLTETIRLKGQIYLQTKEL